MALQNAMIGRTETMELDQPEHVSGTLVNALRSTA
jgi:hypothetical protein